MGEYLIMLGFAALLIVIGILNMRGNISSLHSYHRHRVSEENRLPFGKRVGLGTIICGVGVVTYAVFGFMAETTDIALLSVVGVAILIVCIAVGLALSFYAMIKYNKGIF